MMIRLKRIPRWAWLGVILALILTVSAQAQPTYSDDPGRHSEERERIRDNIETLRMWKLLDALDLTSEQSTEFLPVLKEFQNAKRRFGEARREFLKQMEAALDSQEVNQGKLQESMAGLDAARNRFHQEMEQFLTKSREILTLKQQASLLLFEEKFERRLKESIQEMRRKGPGRRSSGS